ncbi:nucleotidyltransferase family protein [Costertonia aggregata]|uniref:Nucleotidyltransferase family protein n=1 Tax=Costertonia aggregata TaxID=343403 RepID=A0A7H9AUD0_9FLAO|nr:nucleotidyltransferase family protein [Costertonia aggregata]QLG46912.1 nucleotidyltransferase family protein [Costertonia aggregata]
MSAFKNDIPALILAAGASTRMGQPKQLLPWGNSSLLQHAIKVVKASKCNNIYLVLGANSSLIEDTITDPDVTIINNETWKLGLGNSIAVGIRKINALESPNGILIMLADQPFIDQAHLDRLIHTFQHGKKNIIATLYHQKNGVPALFHSTYFSELVQLNDDFGAKGIINTYKNDVVSIASQNNSIDIDTLDEYKYLINKMK